jgi:hypothetical protein
MEILMAFLRDLLAAHLHFAQTQKFQKRAAISRLFTTPSSAFFIKKRLNLIAS